MKVAEYNDDFLKGQLLRTANPKDRYVLVNLKDPDARLVIAFLNPIFHPKKPKRIVVKLASLFLGAMRRKHRVDWAALMEDQVDRMVKNLSRKRKTATPVSTYVGHLYAKMGMLSPAEQDVFDELLNIQSYDGSETDTKVGVFDDGSLASSLVFTKKTKKRSRSV